MTSAEVPLAALDAMLARFRAAVETASSRLLELDGDPTAGLLITGPLTGTTASRWSGASVAQARLWNSRDLLSKLVVNAEGIRGDGRKLGRDEQRSLADLLMGQSVELETVELPPGERSLLGPTQVVRRCSAEELLASMIADYTTVSRTVAEVAAAWAPLAEMIAGLRAGIGGLAATTGQEAVVSQLSTLLETQSSKAVADPLGTTPLEFADLEAALVRARAALSSAGELAAILHERLARARAGLTGLRTQRVTTDALHARATVAISGTPAAVTGPNEAAVHAELCALEALAAAGHVRSVLPRLTVLERTLAAAHAAFAASVARDSAALAERSELRGRLDAYQAMALRRGVAEDPVLSQLAAAAHDRLKIAPCSLPAAASAVAAFSAELARRAPQRMAG